MIQFGNDKIKEIYVGSDKIKEVYHGNELVYRSKPFNPVLYDNGVENTEFTIGSWYGEGLNLIKRSDSIFFDLKTQSYETGFIQIGTVDKINFSGYSALKILWSGVGSYVDGYIVQVALHSEHYGFIDTSYVRKIYNNSSFSKTTTTINLLSTPAVSSHHVLVMAQIGVREPIADASLTIYKIWLE